MKPMYKISEIAKLYGLCADTLRYYEEEGLLRPERSESGYRLYSFNDICTLNVIRDLRALGMSVEQIRRYYENQNVQTTLELLDREDSIIRSQIARLNQDRRRIRLRRERLKCAASIPDMEVFYRDFPERPCLMLEEEVIWEDEIDFVLKKLAKKREGLIKALGTQSMGAMLNEEKRLKGIYTHFSSVFFLDASKKEADYTLAAGRYACIFYRGAYQRIRDVCPVLIGRASEDGYKTGGPVIELYHIDGHDTSHVDEYLTEVQVRVL